MNRNYTDVSSSDKLAYPKCSFPKTILLTLIAFDIYLFSGSTEPIQARKHDESTGREDQHTNKHPPRRVNIPL